MEYKLLVTLNISAMVSLDYTSEKMANDAYDILKLTHLTVIKLYAPIAKI